jgi:hypothetical protein
MRCLKGGADTEGGLGVALDVEAGGNVNYEVEVEYSAPVFEVPQVEFEVEVAAPVFEVELEVDANVSIEVEIEVPQVEVELEVEANVEIEVQL